MLLIISVGFFSNFSNAYTQDNILKQCNHISDIGYNFCNNISLSTYKILNYFSGIKNLETELLKCERFKVSFPKICNIFINEFNFEFLLLFLFLFIVTFIFLFYLSKIFTNVKK